MYTTTLLTLLTATATLAAPNPTHKPQPKFDPKNSLGLPIPLPLDPTKLASTFQGLIPAKENFGLPAHEAQVDQCTKFCVEHEKMCGLFNVGAKFEKGWCKKEYIGCVKVCQGLDSLKGKIGGAVAGGGSGGGIADESTGEMSG